VSWRGGDGLVVKYGPAERGKVVGGGATQVRFGTERHVVIRHLEPEFARQRRDGRVPVLAGASEDARIKRVTGARSRNQG